MSAPVAAGQLTDLESKYQAASKDYEAKVTAALATADATAAAAAVKAKRVQFLGRRRTAIPNQHLAHPCYFDPKRFGSRNGDKYSTKDSYMR